jgi:hypothetical protein
LSLSHFPEKFSNIKESTDEPGSDDSEKQSDDRLPIRDWICPLSKDRVMCTICNVVISSKKTGFKRHAQTTVHVVNERIARYGNVSLSGLDESIALLTVSKNITESGAGAARQDKSAHHRKSEFSSKYYDLIVLISIYVTKEKQKAPIPEVSWRWKLGFVLADEGLVASGRFEARQSYVY